VDSDRDPFICLRNRIVTFWLKKAFYKFVFLVSSDLGVKENANDSIVILIFGLMKEVHFNVIVTSIYRMLRG
jgi:hypothetical protein